MDAINIKTLKELINAFYLAKEPMIVLGQPAIGKTEVIVSEVKNILKKEFGKSWENAYAMIDGSGMPEESQSIPYIDTMAESDGDHLKIDTLPEYKKAKRFLDENSKGTFCFVIDEVTSFNQGDQRTLMNFIQSGRLPNGEYIDKNRVFFILMGNPSPEMPGFEDSDSPTHEMESAVITRAGTFFLDKDLHGFLDYAKDIDEVTLKSNIHPYLQTAFKNEPSLYFKKVEDDVRYATNRTIKKCSNYLYAAEDSGTEWSSWAIKSFFGDQVGGNVIQIMDQLDKLMTVDELFGSEKTPKLTEAAKKKFNNLDEFQKHYLLLKATEDSSPVSFKKEVNVKKLVELLNGAVHLPGDTAAAISHRIQNAPKGSNAYQLRNTKWLVGEDDGNILFSLRNARDLNRSLE